MGSQSIPTAERTPLAAAILHNNTRQVTDDGSQSIPTAERTPLAAAILHNNTRQVTDDDGSQSIPTAERTPLAADNTGKMLSISPICQTG